MKTITIDFVNVPVLEEILEKVTKVAKKLKMAEPSLEIANKRREERFRSYDLYGDGIGSPYYVYIVDVTLTNCDVVLEGWNFIASKDADGVVLGRSDYEIPKKFLEHNTNCDHCNAKRRRNLTYIIYSESQDKWMQVGSSCMKDFIQGHSVTKSFFSYLQSIIDILDYDNDYLDSVRMGHSAPIYQTEEVVATMAASIDLEGFKAANCEVNSTKCSVKRVLGFTGEKLSGNELWVWENAFKGEYLDFAEDCLNWFRNEYKAESFFETNLKNAMLPESGFTLSRNFGLVAYGVGVYYDEIFNKHVTETETRKESQHAYEIGKRLKDITISVFETYENEYEDMYSWNGDWVTTYTIYGYDENDNIIMFESQNSKFLGVKKGETVKVSGTPSYKGTRKNGDKYTKLNRVIHRG